ncbi:MAG: hypothetical protein ACREDR_23360 [Blastocatellia bacterium]
MGPKQTSIPFAQFRSRIDEASLQLEGVEASIAVVDGILRSLKGSKMSIAEALNVKVDPSQRLKMSVEGRNSFVNSLSRRNCEYVFHILYTYFSEYLKRILRAMYECKPLVVVGKAPGKLEFHEIAKFGSLEEVVDHMVESVFRRLEATKNSAQLLERILGHTDVVIPENMLSRAIMYLEMRHLIVHNSGLVDAAFARSYGPFNRSFVEGRKLSMSTGLARSATQAMLELVECVDTQLVTSGFVRPASTEPTTL